MDVFLQLNVIVSLKKKTEVLKCFIRFEERCIRAVL